MTKSILPNLEAKEKVLSQLVNVPEYHKLLGRASMYGDWNWYSAEREFKTAIELNPGNEEAHRSYALFLRIMGRYDEALEEIELVRKLNPLNMGIYSESINCLTLLGKYDEALKAYDEGLKINPDAQGLQGGIIRSYIKQGKFTDALTMAQQLTEGRTRDFRLGYIHARTGDREKAEKILQQFIKEAQKDGFIVKTQVAMLYAGLEENDKAFEWMEKAYDAHDWFLIFMKSDIEWDPVRSDPRFTEFLKKMNLDD